ncbi:helix-turn-helix transcriptional regulator [Candidatus Saccharibacteria bacterium]|jgi:transcriptional regulator with XRE-family HTH domain|nr:helix-turn-helix transcriptional regulator [Candidatus Saccharibacteria bacterium]
MTLPERLIKLRKAAGLSQEEVAEKLELTRQTVSKWETGQSSPDLDKVLPLCNLYNVTPDELLHDGGSEEADEVKAQENAARAEELLEKSVAKKKLIGILSGVFTYVIAIVFIMVSIPVLQMNPVVASGIFLLLLAIATLIIIFSAVNYKSVKKKKQKKLSKEAEVYKAINSVLGFTTLAAYLIISFMTMSWHITWIIWIIYAVLAQIVKLAILLITGNSVDCEEGCE